MTILRHPHIVSLRVLSHPRRARIAAHSPVRGGSCVRAEHIKPPLRGHVSIVLTQVLLIGCEVLLALWMAAALAFCLVIISGFVL
jgi:hypothetical protein